LISIYQYILALNWRNTECHHFVNTHSVVCNIKVLQLLLFILMLLTSVPCFSQVDFHIKRKKLRPATIDTINQRIFIYEVPHTLIYYLQKDRKDYIENIRVTDGKNATSYHVFTDTLSSGKRVIK